MIISESDPKDALVSGVPLPGPIGYGRIPDEVQSDARDQGAGQVEATPSAAPMELHHLAAQQIEKMLK